MFFFTKPANGVRSHCKRQKNFNLLDFEVPKHVQMAVTVLSEGVKHYSIALLRSFFILMLQRVFVVVFHKKFHMGNVIEAEQGNLAAKHGQWLPYSPLCVRHMRSTLTLNRRVLNQKVTKKP